MLNILHIVSIILILLQIKIINDKISIDKDIKKIGKGERKMKKNKVLILIMLMIAIFLTGCDFFKTTESDGKEYTITYMEGETQLELTPTKYTSGVEVTLPTYNKTGFIGWYRNSSFTGSMVTKVASNAVGNKIYYARVEADAYTITFMDGDDVLELEPKYYVKGMLIDLPSYSKENSYFLGWYEEEDFSGKEVTRIFRTDTGNKVYYAKFETISSLSTVLNDLNSYKYTFELESASSEEDPIELDILCDDGKWRFNEKDKTVYTYLELNSDNEYTLYLYGSSGDYTAFGSNYENFIGLYEAYIINLSKISDDDFTFIDNCYQMKADKLSSSAEEICRIKDDIEYKSFKIYTSENKLTKITGTIKDSSNNESSFTFTFSSLGVTNVTIPDATETTADGIVVTPSTIEVELGETFANILKQITVNLVYTYGNSITIDTDACTFGNEYNANQLGSYNISVQYETFSTTFKVDVLDIVDATYEVDENTKLLANVIDEMGEYDGVVYGVTRALSSNAPKVLVVPVEFTDYRAPSGTTDALEDAFFGTSQDTGWESLSSYYYKSSYGKVNITGTVLPVFNTGKTSVYYDSMTDTDAVAEIIANVLAYYDPSINYKDYDTDGDGYIDALYIMYSAPVNYDEDVDSLYWAFAYEYYTMTEEYYDTVEADFYAFIGFDFFYEALASGTSVIYNTETIIHESGHLFGLDDYYDYDSSNGKTGGIGGGDMMDYNVGDHNPFSKIILGWTTPIIIDSDYLTSPLTYDLSPFESSGDCIIICSGWNNSFFDEYYVIDFYTPTGLNQLEAGQCGLFSTKGIRIYHVDATLASPSEANGIWEICKNNNANTTDKLIKLIQADGLDEIEIENHYGDNDDLFQASIGYTNIRWNDNTSANFEIIVNSITNSKANVTIQLND